MSWVMWGQPPLPSVFEVLLMLYKIAFTMNYGDIFFFIFDSDLFSPPVHSM